MSENEPKEKPNFSNEFGTAVAEDMTYRQYLSTVVFILDNFNPIERVYKLGKEIEDSDTQAMINNFGKQDVTKYLEAYKRLGEGVYAAGEDIIGIMRQLAQNRKKSIQ